MLRGPVKQCLERRGKVARKDRLPIINGEGLKGRPHQTEVPAYAEDLDFMQVGGWRQVVHSFSDGRGRATITGRAMCIDSGMLDRKQ